MSGRDSSIVKLSLPTDKIYFKGLNGLRAIAVLAVLVSHVNMDLGNFGLPALPTLDLAGFGVTIFFSLSGFLITYLLLTEKKTTQGIDISKFYLRRILRIWPLYYFYVFLVLATVYVVTHTSVNQDLLYYLFFIPNFPFVFGGILPYLAHYWSLGVEEQFYSFWPWLIKYTKNTLLFLSIFIAVFLLLKVAAILIWGGDSLMYTFLYVTRFDCMAIGGLGAWVLFQQQHNLLRLLVNPIIESVAWIILFFVTINQFHIFSIIDHEIIAGITVVLILNQCKKDKPLINLEIRFFNFIGKISFGIYVYHPLVIFSLTLLPWNRFPEIFALKMISIYAAISLLTIGVAYLSYQFFEKPALELKEKFTVIRSSNTSSQ